MGELEDPVVNVCRTCGAVVDDDERDQCVPCADKAWAEELAAKAAKRR